MNLLILRLRRRLFGGQIVVLFDGNDGEAMLRLARGFRHGRVMTARYIADHIRLLPDGKTSREDVTWESLEDA